MANVTERLIAEIIAAGNVADGSAERHVDDYADAAVRAGRASKDFGTSQKGVARDSAAATKSLGPLVKKIGAAAAAYLSVGAAIRELMAGTQAAVQLESVTRSLAVATGGAKQGAEAFAFVRAESERLGLALGPTAQEFAKVSAASIGTKLAGEGVRDIFSAVSEASSVLGLSTEQQSGALLALGQIMSKGTVQAEELRGQLGERIPGAFQIMARGLGVTTQELGKMLEKGEVLAEEALPAFAAEMRKTFGTDSQQRIETSAAGLARFSTAVFDARVALGTAFLPAVGEATGALAELLEKNEETLSSLGHLAGISLETLVGGVGFLVDNMDSLVIVAGAVALVKLPAVLAAITAGVVKLNAALILSPVAIVALGVGLNVLLNRHIKLTDTAIREITDASDELRESVMRFQAAMGDDASTKQIVAAFDSALAMAAKARGEIDKLIASIAKMEETQATGLPSFISDLFADDPKLTKAREALAQAEARLVAAEIAAIKLAESAKRIEKEFQEALPKTSAELRALIKNADDAEKAVGEIPKALQAFADEQRLLKETARLMLEFGLSAEDAGEAVRLKFAEGVNLADSEVVRLIQTLRAGRAELDFLALLAETAPGNLAERPVGFGDVGEPQAQGFERLERIAALTASVATEDERRTLAIKEATELLGGQPKHAETLRRIIEKNRAELEVTGDELEVHLDLWEKIALAALIGAQDAQGAWGNLLGFIGENINDILDGVSMLGRALTAAGETGLGGLFSGFEQIVSGNVGGGIGTIAQGFGLTGGGTSIFGGQNEGNFLAEGAAIGGKFGGPAGAIIGAALGAFVKSGADDLHSVLVETAGQADLVIQQAEGALAEVAQQVEAVLEGFFNTLQANLSADLDFGAAGLEFHVREDRVRVVVNGIERVFNTIEEAIAFAAQGVLAANAEAEGLGENMRALFESISGPDVVGSLEELQAAINLASALDFEATGVTGELTRSRQELIALGSKYGLSLEAIIALEDKRIAAMKRALEAQIASVFGVDDVVGRFEALTGAIERFDAELAAEQQARSDRLAMIEEELATMDEFGRSIGEVGEEATGTGESMTGTGTGLRELREEGWRTGEGLGDLRDDMGATGEAFGEGSREILRSKESMEALEEEAEALRASLEDGLGGFGADEVGKLWTTAADQVAVSLIQMIQAVEGESANAAELQEIRERQFIFTLAVQIQQAQLLLLTMEGVSEAVRAMLEGVVADSERILEGLASGEIDLPDAVGRRPSGGGRRQQRQQARKDFRDAVAEMEARMAGATDATLAIARAQADLAERGREAKLSVEEIAHAIQLLAELQVAEIVAPFEESALRRRESDTATATREAQERAEAGLAEALEATGGDPDLYAEAARAITRGLSAELAEIGEEGLAGIGGARVGLQQAQMETIREIQFLQEHAEELGLSLREISNAVRDAVLPDLFQILENQAKRVGDEDALALIQERRAQFELRLEQLKFELLVRQLEAVDAITPALQGWIDMGREFFELPTAVGPGPGDDDAPIRRVGGRRRGPSAATKRAEALARALEDVARQTEEWLSVGIDPFQDRLDGLTDRFTDLAAAVLSASGSMDDLIELEESLATARQDLLDELLSGVEDRLRAVELEALGALPAERLATLQGAFAEAIAAAQAAPGEETFADAFELFDLLSSFAGEQFTGGTLAAFLAQIQDQLASLGDLELEDLGLPSQEELLAEISEKLSTVDTSLGQRGSIRTAIGGVGGDVGDVEDAVDDVDSSVADVDTSISDVDTTLKTDTGSAISRKLTTLNQNIGVTGRPLKAMIFDIMTDVSTIANGGGGSSSLARFARGGGGSNPPFDELLVLNTVAIQNNTTAADFNTRELQALSASVVALQGSVDRMRPLAGGR